MDITDIIENEFSQLASLADDRIDLAYGGLLIAKAAYRDLNESLYLERLDRYAPAEPAQEDGENGPK